MFHYNCALLLKILATKPTKWRTLRGFKIWQVHKVDGPYEGYKLGKPRKWTNPTRVKNLVSPQSGQTLRGFKIWQVHKVDEPYEG